jgi:MYXO-CTERM domain-containing protein
MTLRPIAHAALAAALTAAASGAAMADTTQYDFSGTYYTAWQRQPVALGYTGSFTIADPAVTPVRPWMAPDPAALIQGGIWAGSSLFYTGAINLQVTFANGATLTAAGLDLVVNNTTLSNAGAPYPMGLSAQIYTRGAVATGMTVNLICPDGSVDDACDTYANDHDIDPSYSRGDAADQAAQRIAGVYFAFYNAPLSSPAAGVPDLASSFGGAGLGVYAVNELGQNTTTLTQFSGITSHVITVTPAVPEPGTWALSLAGLALLGHLARRRQPR